MSHPDPRRHDYKLTFTILVLACGAVTMLQTIVVPALPTIQHELHASATAGTWVVTSLLVSAAVCTPLIGRLGDMWGKQRLLVVSLALVALGTLISGAATSIQVMILGRLVQGTSGAVYPLAFGIIRDEFPRERVPTGIALVSSVLGIGAAVAIVLAGPIVDRFSYHWLFWFPLIGLVLTAIATHRFVPESPVKRPGHVNWGSVVLLSAWLACLLLAISEGASWGWGSVPIVGLALAAGGLFSAWMRNERRAPEPFVDIEMMRRREVWTVNLVAVLVGAGMFSGFLLIPQFVEMPASTGFGFGASVVQGGLFLLPFSAAMLLVSPVAGRLSSSVGLRVPLLLGTLTTAASFALLVSAHSQRWEVYLASTVLGVGIGLAYSALPNLIVAAVRPDETGIATGMNTVIRYIGQAIGGELAASVLASNIAHGRATERGFMIAFSIAAAAAGASFLAALTARSRLRESAPPVVGAARAS